MRLKMLGSILFVVAALGAVLAGSALATATKTAANWYSGEYPGTKLTGALAVTAENEPGTTTVFETEVAGMKVKFTSTAASCESCTITNEPTGASGRGFLKFTGISVVSPTNCTLSSVKTKELTMNADYTEGTSAMVKFTPTAGETASFATFEFGGPLCPLGGPRSFQRD